MNGRVIKLLKAYCDHYHRDFENYKKNYKELPADQKKIVLDAIKKALPILN